jgi:hypothetical protein
MSDTPNHPLTSINHDEAMMSVSVSSDMPQTTDIRRQIYEFALSEAVGPRKEIIRRIYDMFREHNECFWEGQLDALPILITPTFAPAVMGDAAEFSGFGCKLQMRIRPAIADGDYPTGKFAKSPKAYWRMRPGHEFEDRMRFISDIVLHEMVHLWLNQNDAPGRHEHKGHGRPFTNERNRISALLGLLPVKSKRRKGDPPDAPMSSQWPHCVRPGGMFGIYYGTLWERVGDEGTGKNTDTTDADEQTQVQLLCEAWWTFAGLYISEKTTDEDRAEFQRICFPNRAERSSNAFSQLAETKPETAA